MTDEPIRFLLNGQPRHVSGLAPTTTVLDYLRLVERLCGTKEGCAEGDCGACTVALAEPDGHGALCYRAVNSCIQFLPTLDGKALVTVEGLKDDGKLHPVQRAMVETHGSQCGFCTPGFVMSLFALWHSDKRPDRTTVLDALSGNLCRCTGYRPILAAAERMYDKAAPDAHDRAAPQTVSALKTLSRSRGFSYSAEGGAYFAPRTLAEALAALAKSPDAKVLAGGTDFGLWVTKELRDIPAILHVGEIAELKGVRATATHLEIGAAASWTDALPALIRHWPTLAAYLGRFAGLPTRNAATVGGNIASASPIGDGPPVFLALDGSVVLAGAAGERETPLDAFFVAYRRTALRPGELLVRLRVPLPRPNSTVAAYKLSKRYDQDISAVAAAFRVELDGGRVALFRAAYGGMAAMPKRAQAFERAMIGHPWTAETIAAARPALARDFQPIDDFRASAGYRLEAAGNLALRFWHATQGIAVEVFADG